MKKLLILFAFFIFITPLASLADFMPTYTNSLRHYGMGATRVMNNVKIYEQPNEKSNVLYQFYWNNAQDFLCTTQQGSCSMSNIFAAYIPGENLAFLSTDDENSEWVKVCYDQKNLLFGWIKKSDGAKFYTWKDLFYRYGKKYGVYAFRNTAKKYKELHAKPSAESMVVDSFDISKYITPWLIQGNWMLVKVIDIDNTTKTGWVQWRNEDGSLNGFMNFK